jgi:preprotein translocase subunit SecD
MLSLLLTAVLLVGALVAALRLRSALHIAVALGIAAVGFVALARRSLDALAEPRIHLVYQVDAEHANEPGPDLTARAGSAVRERIERLGVRGAEVRAEGSTVTLESPATPEEAEIIRDALSVTGLLEFVMVADEEDFFKDFSRDYGSEQGAPKEIRFEQENGPLGPGKTALRYYAFMPRGEGEAMKDTLRRLKSWTDTLRVPDGKRIAFEKVVRRDFETDTWEEEGWRTFLLDRAPLLTGRHLQDAQARPDQNDPGVGGWLVDMEFTDEGGRIFEDVTGRMIKRRFAIVVDGVVESAPVIQTRIGGGRGVITMGAGAPDEQLRNAKKLEVVLRSGALPAPLQLMVEDSIAPTIGPAVFQGLVAAAGLLLAGTMIFGLAGAFARKRPA